MINRYDWLIPSKTIRLRLISNEEKVESAHFLSPFIMHIFQKIYSTILIPFRINFGIQYISFGNEVAFCGISCGNSHFLFLSPIYRTFLFRSGRVDVGKKSSQTGREISSAGVSSFLATGGIGLLEILTKLPKPSQLRSLEVMKNTRLKSRTTPQSPLILI